MGDKSAPLVCACIFSPLARLDIAKRIDDAAGQGGFRGGRGGNRSARTMLMMRSLKSQALTLAAIALAATLLLTDARADQPWYADLHDDQHEPWSLSPMVGAAYGGGSQGVFVGDVALRVRYGSPPDDKHGAPSPRLFAFGAALGTVNFDTLEPQAFIGHHNLPERWTIWSQGLHANVRFDLGGGYRFGSEDLDDSIIVNAKLAVGVIVSRAARYMLTESRGGVVSARDRFRSEIDVVLKAQAAFEGDWYLAVGLELDPLRIVTDVARMIVP